MSERPESGLQLWVDFNSSSPDYLRMYVLVPAKRVFYRVGASELNKLFMDAAGLDSYEQFRRGGERELERYYMRSINIDTKESALIIIHDAKISYPTPCCSSCNLL